MLVTLTPAAALGVLIIIAFAALYVNDELRWPTFTARPVIDPPPPAPRPVRTLRQQVGPVVIPGRHRLENALEASAAPYRPVMWPYEPRPLVGALEPVSARPYVTSEVVIELTPEERPTVELTPVS